MSAFLRLPLFNTGTDVFVNINRIEVIRPNPAPGPNPMTGTDSSWKSAVQMTDNDCYYTTLTVDEVMSLIASTVPPPNVTGVLISRRYNARTDQWEDLQ